MTTSSPKNEGGNQGYRGPVAAPEALFALMARIRCFEEVAGQALRDAVIPGAVHLSIGQEGVSTGVGAAMAEIDRSTSTHRGHGDMIAVGGSLVRMFAELLGRSDGLCGGKGGSMHIADRSVGSLGANGIVGGGIPIAVGSALASHILRDGAVTVAFFGDGAANTGAMFESLNLASIWRAPVVFVCENNLYGEFTAAERMTAGEIWDRAKPFGIPSYLVNGSDVIEVHAIASQAIASARAGKGPQFIEARCFRMRGHTEGDELFLGGQQYRSEEEVRSYEAADPLRVIVDNGYIDAETAEVLFAEAQAEVEAAFTAAKAGPEPGREEAFLTAAGWTERS